MRDSRRESRTFAESVTQPAQTANSVTSTRMETQSNRFAQRRGLILPYAPCPPSMGAITHPPHHRAPSMGHSDSAHAAPRRGFTSVPPSPHARIGGLWAGHLTVTAARDICVAVAPAAAMGRRIHAPVRGPRHVWPAVLFAPCPAQGGGHPWPMWGEVARPSMGAPVPPSPASVPAHTPSRPVTDAGLVQGTGRKPHTARLPSRSCRSRSCHRSEFGHLFA